MTDLYTPVIDALTMRLAADSVLQSLIGNPARLFDQRPAQATFPFVIMGESETRDVGSKSLAITSQLVTLQVFSRQRASKEARQIIAAIRAVLHDALLTLSVGNAARCQEEYTNIRWDDESQATRALLRYRLVVSD